MQKLLLRMIVNRNTEEGQAYRYEVMSHCQTKVMEGYFAECRAKRK